MNSMVTTNQKSIINTQKTKRKELKIDTEENHQTKRKEAKRRRNREVQKQLENSKMSMPVNNHLNVNALNAPIKRLMALIVIKGSRQKKHIISVNIHALNVGALEYTK